ncbi:hypothetical protein JIN85_13280 [Luteolibacter pohnpeiensis]|uniref:Rhodanese domain-containing protein n=1 Tax=Luteolibacter pohnpeiensis TaxID=454153 RepID=A0A934SC11_9BACT|nr:rhodanese-like domain-containing protein [Luteolibacter pohnpeiensis]MBK1883392.1 hypothetical protein [Luteolibacter pohnpeiensis]
MTTAAELSTASTMREILDTLPGARRAIFAKYHLGGCQSCAFSDDETLAELCQRAGELPETEVLAHLLESHEHDLQMLVEPSTAKQWIEAGAVRLIDIRTREEHDAVLIENSDFFTQDLQQELFAGNPEQTFVLYDHSGKGVLDQVAWFRGHGLKKTFGLRGGIDAWSQEVDSTIPRYRIEVD